jgi:beta-lactamase class A
VALSDAVAKGDARWDELLTLSSAEKVSGSGVLGSEFSDGVRLPLRDVANLMIVLSDNTATNMILERIGADRVNTVMDRLGLRTTRSLRKIRGDGSVLKSPSGWSAAGRLPENQRYGIGISTPRDMVTLLEKLERGEAVSPEASREMLAILKRCQDDTGLRRRIGGVPVASKSGALDALRSDVGIVYGKDARVAMAITVEGIPAVDYTPDNAGSVLIADLAKMLVEGLAKEK